MEYSDSLKIDTLKIYERSTHNLSYLWKSTMMPGALTPFCSEIALPGDTFDFELDADGMTHPTNGPLFGSLKMQLDMFAIPLRLYNANLHMNALNIGRTMSDVKLPQVEVVGRAITEEDFINPLFDLDNAHTSPSSLLSYLNIRGCGTDSNSRSFREFNAVGILAYMDTYKNYYANKQEEIGMMIHHQVKAPTWTIRNSYIINGGTRVLIEDPNESHNFGAGSTLEIVISNPNSDQVHPNDVIFDVSTTPSSYAPVFIGQAYDTQHVAGNTILYKDPNGTGGQWFVNGESVGNNEVLDPSDIEPKLRTFPLNAIDDMKENILKHFSTSRYLINNDSELPYSWIVERNDADQNAGYSQLYPANGLCVKTYQSDLFNNWVSTEWIDGDNGVNAVTAVDTTGDSFTIDELNLSKKVYDMLNRIAVSGGSYDDWLDAVYTQNRKKSSESPMFIGGMSQSLVFQEVVSNNTAQVEGQDPLGTLAGKGRMSQNKKGGKVVFKADEPMLILGLASLTPILDYSQGNKWDVNLKTLDDLHKPSLDEIGFQDLLTDQMTWWDTYTPPAGSTFYSAGKQPAWINYMTNVNITRGNFAKYGDQMFMTLNRRYSPVLLDTQIRNGDITTYIDPAKFNDIFADSRLDAQNFWIQIAVNITARRKMSARVMPNL